MGRGISTPTPPDTGWDVGALSLVLSACDLSQTGQGRLTCVNRAAPHVCPHHIKCGKRWLGRRAFKTLDGTACSVHSLRHVVAGEGLEAVCLTGPRGVTWRPEAPWPPHNHLTSPRGGGEKAGRTATWLDGKVIPLYHAYPRTHITDKYNKKVLPPVL
uniref:Uncharacterized protein n=1 Tax=Oryza sativa subsp. japonica TaxID=39947 RepID=Q5Z8T2_ORYSJ|nr:hypothetical protein [Oryza sativa Japonica Group]BAD53822.1 hypothetical protein [Oryza sativa Japonica Group]